MANQHNILEKPLDFSKYLFRCSSWGNLMGEPKGSSMKKDIAKNQKSINKLQEEILAMKDGIPKEKKIQKVAELVSVNTDLQKQLLEEKPTLSETAQTYLLEAYCCERDEIKKDIHSKYFEKGLAVEEDAIELLSEHDDCFYTKNTTRLSNEFITGECDIIHENKKIIDHKAAWDRFTFQKAISKPLSKIYEWQGIGYEGLWGVNEFEVVYTLMNMPEGLVADECRRILWQYGSDKENSQEYIDSCNEFIKKTKFNHLPITERIFKFPVIVFDKELYNYGITMVGIARDWLNEYALKEYRRVNKIAPIAVVVEKETNKFVDIVEKLNDATNEIIENLSKEEENEETFEKPKKIDTLQQLANKIADIHGLERPSISEEKEEIPQEISVEETNKEIEEELKEIEEEITDSQEQDFSIVLEQLQRCNSLTETQELFEQISFQYAEIPQEIAQEFRNREIELSKPQQQSQETQVEENTEEKELRLMVDSCKTKEEVIELYKKIKDKFVTFSWLKEYLTTKRDSFNVVVEEAKAKPTPTKTQPQQTTQVTKIVPQLQLEEGVLSLEKQEELKKKLLEVENVEGFKKIAGEYLPQETRGLAGNREIRKWINENGIALEKRLKGIS